MGWIFTKTIIRSIDASASKIVFLLDYRVGEGPTGIQELFCSVVFYYFYALLDIKWGRGWGGEEKSPNRGILALGCLPIRGGGLGGAGWRGGGLGGEPEEGRIKWGNICRICGGPYTTRLDPSSAHPDHRCRLGHIMAHGTGCRHVAGQFRQPSLILLSRAKYLQQFPGSHFL